MEKLIVSRHNGDSTFSLHEGKKPLISDTTLKKIGEILKEKDLGLCKKISRSFKEPSYFFPEEKIDVSKLEPSQREDLKKIIYGLCPI